MTDRRSFLLGLGAVLAAPAVVKAESLMKVVAIRRPALWLPADGRMVSRFDYPELFAILSVMPVLSVMPTRFQLPDLRDGLGSQGGGYIIRAAPASASKAGYGAPVGTVGYAFGEWFK